MSRFELDELPINNLYSESEETKNLRHKYYETENKLSIYKIIATAILALGLVILGLFLIITLIKTNQKKGYSLALLYIGAIFLFGGITAEIIITQIKNNLLNPIDEDIKRSVMNDQLELAGAKTNRRKINKVTITETENKDNKEIDNKDNQIIELQEQKNLQLLIELQEKYNSLTNKYNRLIDKYNNLQEENKNLNNRLTSLQKKNQKMALKSSTPKLEIQTPIKKEKKKEPIKKEKKESTVKQIHNLSTIRIILIPIAIALFVMSLIFTIINLVRMDNATSLIIWIVCTCLTIFANILIFVLTSPTIEKEKE